MIGAKAAASAAFRGPFWSREVLHILQVTDCHLFAEPRDTLLGVCCHASLSAVLEAACGERRPDAVLATGDIAQQPGAETYRLFLATLRRWFDGPLLCVPGNHDLGEPFSAELPTEDLELDGWRLVGVDTHVDGEVGGVVGDSELRRLRGRLEGHALVAGHHCPVNTGCAWLDEHRIANGDALLDALAAANAYAFGHIHQPFERPASTGPALYGTPSTCFQFAVDSPNFAIDTAQPGYRWLHLADDGAVTTEVRRAENFQLTIDLRDRDRR